MAEINRQLQTIDSLRIATQDDAFGGLLLNLQQKYSNTPNPVMAVYYIMREDQSRDNEYMMNVYADSALAVFDNGEVARLYPAQYFKTLLAKSEACKINKKFNLALQFYYKAAMVEGITSCDRFELLSRIAGIYYDQQNFSEAGKSWYTSFLTLDSCSEGLPGKIFMQKQGVLDNAGLAYGRAGKLDSAAFCYFRDIKLIDSDYAGKVAPHLANPSRLIVYDNLGGLYLDRGMFDSAEYYLTRCMAINIEDKSGITIPVLLKLADLYTQTGNTEKAKLAFEQSRVLLAKFTRHNPQSQVKWHKLYAAFLLKNNQAAQANRELYEYIRLRDSIDKVNTAVLTLNVGKEFNTIQQEHILEELKIKDKINQVYRWAIVMVALLSAIIIILVYRNLKKSRKSHRDTIRHNSELQKTLEQLEAVNKNYIRIMRVMAHDLRNPLGGITGIAAMLQQEAGLNEESRRMLQLIESTGNHSMDMINELLKTGLAEEHEQLEVQTLDLENLLQNTVELLQFKAREKKQTLLFDSNGVPVMADINHEKMWRVFTNIIVNAIKFTPAGGTIRASIYKHGWQVLITIADTGIGIPAKDKDEVFDMFTAAKRPGTNGEKPFGLGLSISKNIIQKHQGKIWFTSDEGKGTTFYIELPAVT